MNSINVNIPIANLPQVTHQHADALRIPIVHQLQNADISRDRLDLRMAAPQAAEEAEGKIVDPKDRREEEKRRSKKRRQGQEEEPDDEAGNRTPGTEVTMSDSGRLIDLEA